MKDCNLCGKCCIKYGDGGLSATPEEIEMWEVFQPQIYKYVRDGKIWNNPETGEKLKQCPFLKSMVIPNKNNSSHQKKYTCDIYLDRPEDCRHYPTSISEMIRDKCEMIETVDLENPKQAQIKLDILMSDSRPPLR
ncbi:MAG: zinc/iron-chelating domain-containing protein [SAR86 cluster bacterium]|uniref:Zinc/iron-chelating domain-containing protein n=1 Tax=SAR86 cluster bacterium TaxID=2030880 RepID=A0A2A5CGC2_9GAMM|nr:MAG: zinc/iron-chelating domain-containing protein [SAR86 cluster bacterium]